MDLWQLLRMMARRWYATVPLVALVAVSVWFAGGRVQPSYTADTTVLYVAPLAAQEDTGRPNPWRESGISTTAQAVAATVLGPEARRDLAGQGLSTNYSIAQDSRSQLAEVSTEASTEDLAQRSLAAVVVALEGDLRIKQEQYLVPDVGQIKIVRLTGEGNVVVTIDGYKQVVVAVAGAGLLLTLGIVVLLDAILLPRSGGLASFGRRAHASMRRQRTPV